MSMAEGMRHTTENIIASRHVRVKALGSLVNQVSQTLAEARNGMGKQAAWRKAMRREQAAELTRFAGQLAGSIGVKLSQFGQELERAAKNRALGAKELKGRLRQEAQTLSRSVNKTLADYRAQHAQRSAALRSRLRGFAGQIAKGVQDWTAATRVLLTGCRAEIDEASRAWRSLASASARNGEKKEAPPVMAEGKANGALENAPVKMEVGPVKIRRERRSRGRSGGLGDKGKGMTRWDKKLQS